MTRKKWLIGGAIACAVIGVAVTGLFAKQNASHAELSSSSGADSSQLQVGRVEAGSVSISNRQAQQSSSKDAQAPATQSHPQGKCVTTPIPYETITENDSNMLSGKTQTTSGLNGSRITCYQDGKVVYDNTVNPVNAHIYIGTRQPQTTTTPTSPALEPYPTGPSAETLRQQRIRNCLAVVRASGGGGGSAEQNCYDIQ